MAENDKDFAVSDEKAKVSSDLKAQIARWLNDPKPIQISISYSEKVRCMAVLLNDGRIFEAYGNDFREVIGPWMR